MSFNLAALRFLTLNLYDISFYYLAEKGEVAEDEEKVSPEDCKKFATFTTAFGRAIKLGIIEDTSNRNRLAKLLRFHTSKSGSDLVSLDDYIARMKEGQKEIYFLGGGLRS